MVAPRFPGIPGYRELDAGLRELGLRHVGDLVWPESTARRGGGFQILDGYRVHRSDSKKIWYLVDRKLLAEARSLSAERHSRHRDKVHRLFDLLEAGSASDAMNLRHLLLYQLLTRLGEPGRPCREQDVEHLGVTQNEVPAVLALAAATRPFEPSAQRAAETLLDAIVRREVVTAANLAAAIPVGHDDERLTRLCVTLAARLGSVGPLLAESDRHAAAGDPKRAADALRRAVNHVPDDPHAKIKLFELAPRLGDGGAVISASAAPAGGIVVRCAAPRSVPPGPPPEYELCRLIDGDPRAREPIRRTADLTTPVTDTQVDFGETVVYAVLPLRAGRVCGPAVAGAPYRHAPDVYSVRLRATPEGVRARWRAPHGAEELRVERSGPAEEGASVPVEADRYGFLDPVLEHGEYRYTVRCRFTARNGERVWSDGWTGAVTVGSWPGPVDILQVEVLDQELPALPDAPRQVRVTWRPATTGEGRMTAWPFTPRRRGQDISAFIDRLPPALAYEPAEEPATRSTVVLAPPGKVVRLTGVSKLGRRAVTGDSVLICLPRADSGATALQVHHLDRQHAEVVFAWPEPAALIRLIVEQEGRAPRSWVVPRSRAQDRLAFRANGEPATVTMHSQVRPNAHVAFPQTFTAVLEALPPELPAAAEMSPGYATYESTDPPGSIGGRPDPVPPVRPSLIRRLTAAPRSLCRAALRRLRGGRP